MSKVKAITVTLSALFGLVVMNTQATVAQSTNFHTPTTDAVAKGKAYLEFNYLRQVPEVKVGATTPGTSIYVPRALVGLGGNVEVGAHVSFVDVKGAQTTNAFFSPNAKWQFYHNEEHGVAASAGGILYTPINNRAGGDTFGMIYGNVSKKVQAAYGPRFTVGAYRFVGTDEGRFAGPRGGALVGYEQPIHPRASIVADWASGKNGLGYFTPGVSVSLPKSSQLKLGYSFGNNSYTQANGDKNNRFLFVRFGITL